LSKGLDALLKVAMAVISPLILIGLLEGLAYIWEERQANGPFAWELVASRRMIWERHLEPGDGYTLIKPGSHYEWQDIRVEINTHGLRGPEIDYVKPPDTYRILNLGDSIAMGWGVKEDETYGRRLEQKLNAASSADPRDEVINAGVPGWNLANELAYLGAVGLKYEPDLVLLDLTIANDINGKNALLADNYPPLIGWLRTNTYFWPFLSIQARWLEARAQGRDRIDVIDPPTNPAKYFPLDATAERWTELWDRVAAMQALATENEAQFVLVLFPLEFQVLDESFPTLPQELLTAKANDVGIPVVDLLPVFRQACREKPGGPCQLEDRYLFADVWMHPSAFGHQLAADAIAAALPKTP
jgi:lysophospholipase L1-like esterase